MSANGFVAKRKYVRDFCRAGGGRWGVNGMSLRIPLYFCLYSTVLFFSPPPPFCAFFVVFKDLIGFLTLLFFLFYRSLIDIQGVPRLCDTQELEVVTEDMPLEGDVAEALLVVLVDLFLRAMALRALLHAVVVLTAVSR